MPGCVRDHGRFEAAASGEPAEDDPTRCVQRNRAHHERCGERKLRRYRAEVSEAEEHGGREFPPGVLSTSREPALLFKRLATLRQDLAGSRRELHRVGGAAPWWRQTAGELSPDPGALIAEPTRCCGAAVPLRLLRSAGK